MASIGTLTQAQQIALAVVPKATAFLSFIGSIIVAFQVLKKRRQEQKPLKVYRRLILGMSCADILSSIAWFCTTWPIPVESHNNDSFPVFQASGTQTTCNIQGFLGQFCITTVFYNACLACYYSLVISKGWSEKRIQKVEPLLHIVAVLYGILTCSLAASWQMYNSVGWACWIGAHPPGCVESWRAPLLGQLPNCTRGDNATLFIWAAFFGPLWLAIFISMIVMTMIYKSVYNTEEQNVKYTRQWEQHPNIQHDLVLDSFPRCIPISRSEEYPPISALDTKPGRHSAPILLTGALRDSEEPCERLTSTSRNQVRWSEPHKDFDEESHAMTQSKPPADLISNQTLAVAQHTPSVTANSHHRPSKSTSVVNRILLIIPRHASQRSSAAVSLESKSTAGALAENSVHRKSRKVATQAIFYVGALYLTWTFPTIYNLVFTIRQRLSFPLLFLEAVAVPTPGMFNFLMYIRPSYLRCRKRYKSLRGLRLFWMLILGKSDKELKLAHKAQLKLERKQRIRKERNERKQIREQLNAEKREAPKISRQQSRERNVRPSNHPVEPVWEEKGSFRRSSQAAVAVPKRLALQTNSPHNISSRTKTSFDPSIEYSSENSKASSKKRRKQVINKWQSNYHNYPGRHRHGEREFFHPEPLDSEEDQVLWQFSNETSSQQPHDQNIPDKSSEPQEDEEKTSDTSSPETANGKTDDHY